MRSFILREPRVIVAMGIGGSGKTTVGGLLSQRLGVSYADADAFHPESNIVKMRSGQPLDDSDRLPWLRSIARHIQGLLRHGESGVVSASALKREYRDVLRVDPAVWFLHLSGESEVIRQRLVNRKGHFFTEVLLQSQLRDLEPLSADEPGIVVDISRPPAKIVELAVGALLGLTVLE